MSKDEAASDHMKCWKDLETGRNGWSNANTALLNRRNRLEAGRRGEQGRMHFSSATSITKKEGRHPLMGQWHRVPQG